MAEQVHAPAVRPDGGGEPGQVRGQRIRRIVTVAGFARRLVLPAHVDRDHPAARRGQRLEHGKEVFLAAGVAGHE